MVAARFYTVVESTRITGIDGYAYLRYAATTASRGEEPLLPHERIADHRSTPAPS